MGVTSLLRTSEALALQPAYDWGNTAADMGWYSMPWHSPLSSSMGRMPLWPLLTLLRPPFSETMPFGEGHGFPR